MTSTRKLVVLDLDNTLVFTWEMFPRKELQHDYHFECDGEKLWGKKRPHLDHFLMELNKIADIGIWSASPQSYIDAILRIILENHEFKPVMVLDKSRCSTTIREGCCFPAVSKPLKKIWSKGTYNRQNTLVVDDLPTTYVDNYGNAVAIKQFNGESDDNELLSTLEKIKIRLDQDDVRIFLR